MARDNVQVLGCLPAASCRDGPEVLREVRVFKA